VARVALPDIHIGRHDRARALVAGATGGAAISTAVVFPTDGVAPTDVAEAALAGLIAPILIGPAALIHAAAATAGLDISAFRPIEEADPKAAAGRAVLLAREGEAGLLMRCNLHTDDLMGAVVASQTGPWTARRISHIYWMDVPDHPRPLLLTDAAIDITPTLEDKADILRNAIDLAHVLGLAKPRVAILAAVEPATCWRSN
jgi:phosphate butyryltransferase